MFVRCLDKGELAVNSSLNCEKYLRDVALIQTYSKDDYIDLNMC